MNYLITLKYRSDDIEKTQEELLKQLLGVQLGEKEEDHAYLHSFDLYHNGDHLEAQLQIKMAEEDKDRKLATAFYFAQIFVEDSERDEELYPKEIPGTVYSVEVKELPSVH